MEDPVVTPKLERPRDITRKIRELQTERNVLGYLRGIILGWTQGFDTPFGHTPCYNHLKTNEYLIITFSTLFFLCVCDQIMCLNLCIHTRIVHLRDLCAF